MALGRYVWLLLPAAAIWGCDRGDKSPRDASRAASGSGGERPNIVIYMVDTMRGDCLGCYGHPVVETPAVDRLAREGTLFENAFAQSSWTRPSIASILTSTYPGVHRAQQRGDVLSEASILLSEVLKEGGYSTCCITANPNIGSFFGFNQGFDDFIELYARREPGKVKARELSTTCDVVTRRAVEWINQAPRPFLLVILTIDPHAPYTPPAEFDRYGGDYTGLVDGTGRTINRPNLSPADKERVRSLYYGEIAFNDHAFAMLQQSLRRQRLDDDTVIVFTSDHGEEFWEHGLLGHGKALFDESCRVPLIVRYPRGVPANTRVSRTVRLVDIFPTLLQLAALPIPENLDGRPLFNAQSEPVATFSNLEHDGRSLIALRDHPWKLIMDISTGEEFLFDLADSPGELVNAIEKYPDRAATLRERIFRQVRRNAERSASLHGTGGPAQVTEEQMSQDALRTLRTLGYVGDGDDE